jgi:gas vesicle protein
MDISCNDGDDVRILNGKIIIFSPATVTVVPKKEVYMRESIYKTADDIPQVKKYRIKSKRIYNVKNCASVVLEPNQCNAGAGPMFLGEKFSLARSLSAMGTDLTFQPQGQGFQPQGQGFQQQGQGQQQSQQQQSSSPPPPSDLTWCNPTIEEMPILKNTTTFKWSAWTPPAAPVFPNLQNIMTKLSSGGYKLNLLSRSNKVIITGIKALTTSMPTPPAFPQFPDMILSMRIVIPGKYNRYMVDGSYRDPSDLPSVGNNVYSYPVYYKDGAGQYQMYSIEIDVPNPKYGKTTMAPFIISGGRTVTNPNYKKSTEPSTIKQKVPILFGVFKPLDAVTDTNNLILNTMNTIGEIMSKPQLWDFTWQEIAHSGAVYGGKDADFFKSLYASIDGGPKYLNDMITNAANAGQVGENFKRAIELVNKLNVVLGKVSSNVGLLVGNTVNNLKDSGAALLGMANQLPTQIMAMVQQFGTIISDSVSGYLKLLQQQATDITNYSKSIVTALQTYANELKTKTQQFMTDLMVALKSDMEDIQVFFNTIITDLSNAILTDMKGLNTYMGDLGKSITANVSANTSGLSTAMQADMKDSINWVRGQLGKFSTCMTNNVNFVKQEATKALAKVKQEFDNALADVKANLQKIQDDVMAQMEGVKKILADVQSLADKLKIDVVKNQAELDKLKSDYAAFVKDVNDRLSSVENALKTKTPAKGFWPFSGAIPMGAVVEEY